MQTPGLGLRTVEIKILLSRKLKIVLEHLSCQSRDGESQWEPQAPCITDEEAWGPSPGKCSELGAPALFRRCCSLCELYVDSLGKRLVNANTTISGFIVQQKSSGSHLYALRYSEILPGRAAMDAQILQSIPTLATAALDFQRITSWCLPFCSASGVSHTWLRSWPCHSTGVWLKVICMCCLTCHVYLRGSSGGWNRIVPFQHEPRTMLKGSAQWTLRSRYDQDCPPMR